MSSSWGNTINITDAADDLYGKVMSLHDDAIVPYLISVTRVPMNDIRTMEARMKEGAGESSGRKNAACARDGIAFPRTKKRSTRKRHLRKRFRKRKHPKTSKSTRCRIMRCWEVFSSPPGFVQSMNDAKRLAEGGAISSLDTKEIVRDARAPAKKGTYKIGKRRFLKIT